VAEYYDVAPVSVGYSSRAAAILPHRPWWPAATVKIRRGYCHLAQAGRTQNFGLFAPPAHENAMTLI
jgi:hypothetical protein